MESFESTNVNPYMGSYIVANSCSIEYALVYTNMGANSSAVKCSIKCAYSNA